MPGLRRRFKRDRARGNARGECDNCSRLRQRIRELERKVDELSRAAKRQSAPFSKGAPKRNPARGGRKPGAAYGVRASRRAPSVVDRVIDVPLPKRCADCAGPVTLERTEAQFHLDIPDPATLVTRYEVAIGSCAGCGRRVQARHPLQTSDALGAAAVQLGPRLVAVATVMNKGLGMAHAKVADALKQMFGVEVSRAGLARAIGRIGDAAEPTYDAICDTIKASGVVTPDETGWRVGGQGAWLWAFAAEGLTAYQVAAGRAFEAAAAMLGADYAGVIVRDGWVVYRGFDKATHQSLHRAPAPALPRAARGRPGTGPHDPSSGADAAARRAGAAGPPRPRRPLGAHASPWHRQARGARR